MTNETQIYHIGNSKVPPERIMEQTGILEKKIQNIIENGLETYLDIRFIATEYSTGKLHGGIIDTIGIDNDNVPVIIEYKRSVDSGAALQGLYYLTWLINNKKEFELSVLNKIGKKVSQNIDWTQPRVICIANEFKKYVKGAVTYLPNIELIEYRLYENDILTMTNIHNNKSITIKPHKNKLINKDVWFPKCSNNLKNIFKDIKEFLLELDPAIEINETATYTAFNKDKNFISIRFYSNYGYIKIGSIIDPDTIDLVDGFTQDERDKNGSPPGSLMIYIRSRSDFEKSKYLLIKSYSIVSPIMKMSEFTPIPEDR